MLMAAQSRSLACLLLGKEHCGKIAKLSESKLMPKLEVIETTHPSNSLTANRRVNSDE
jgi:hypothetical protein